MTRKRERLEIMYDILEVVRTHNKPVKPTHILYKSNLSHKMLTEYLHEMIAKELLTEVTTQNTKTYQLTEKGLRYLQDFVVIRGFMESYGLE